MAVENKPEEKKKTLEFKGGKIDFSSVYMGPTMTGRYSSPYGGFGHPDDGPTYRPDAVRPNVRAALDYLDTILLAGGEDAEELWDVLSALRGPDQQRNYGGETPKRDVTIPIRRAAFPRTAADIDVKRQEDPYGMKYGRTPGVYQRASFGYPSDARYRGDRFTGDDHFKNHGYRAARALGLV